MNSHPDMPLSRADMISMFQEMGKLCERRGAYFEIAIYGGSAIMLSFDYRQSTVDIDFVPVFGASKDIQDIANLAAQSLGFQANILRDDVAVFISDLARYAPYGEFPKGTGHLRIYTATPEYIFSMKILAMRSSIETQDLRDAWELADLCGITNIDEAVNTLSKFYPQKTLPVRNRLILEDVFEAKRQKQGYTQSLGW